MSNMYAKSIAWSFIIMGKNGNKAYRKKKEFTYIHIEEYYSAIKKHVQQKIFYNKGKMLMISKWKKLYTVYPQFSFIWSKRTGGKYASY